MLLDHPSDGPTAILTQFGAIFVSLELSRSTWLITSLSPGKGEKMSKHSLTAGDVAELMKLFADLKRKAAARTGQTYPIITIQDAGLGGVRAAPRSETGGDREPRGRSRLDCDIAPATTGQDGQARWRDAVAGASGLQARRATGLRDGGCALA